MKVGIVLLVRDKDSDPKILVLKRGMTAPWKPGAWNLPGGIHEEGESVLKTAIRELEEETGITTAKISNSPIYVHDAGSWEEYYFIAEDVQNQDPGPGDGESDGWDFVNQENYQKLNYATDSIPKAIEKAFKSLSNKVLESLVREVLRK